MSSHLAPTAHSSKQTHAMGIVRQFSMLLAAFDARVRSSSMSTVLHSCASSASISVLAAVICCLSGNAAEESPAELAARLFEAGEFSEAKRIFEFQLQSNPKNAEALLYLGWIGLEQKRLEAAAKRFEQATQINKTNSLYWLWLGRAHGLQAREAGIPGGAMLCTKAKAAFDKAVALDPNNLEARYDLLQWYLETPGIVGGSTKLALVQAEEIRQRDAHLGNVAIGRVFEHQKNLTEAERAYQRAIGLNPARFEAHYALGYIHQRTKNYAKAIAAFEKILALPSTNEGLYQIGKTEAYYQIGKTCLLWGQRLDRAEEVFRIYLQSKPNFYMPSLAWAHVRLGNVYEKNGNRARAQTEYKTALRLEPHHKEALAALKSR